MRKKLWIILLLLSVVLLFISSFIPIVIGNFINNNDVIIINEYDGLGIFNKHDYPMSYSPYSYNIKSDSSRLESSTNTIDLIRSSLVEIEDTNSSAPIIYGDSSSSPWPMHGHDPHHTGKSPYSTENNNGFLKWYIDTEGRIDGSPVIYENGICYIGTQKGYLYAVYPNGTQKWKLKLVKEICTRNVFLLVLLPQLMKMVSYILEILSSQLDFGLLTQMVH